MASLNLPATSAQSNIGTETPFMDPSVINDDNVETPSHTSRSGDNRGHFMQVSKARHDMLYRAWRVISGPLTARGRKKGYVYAATTYTQHHMPIVKIGWSSADPFIRVHAIEHVCGVPVEHYMQTESFRGANQVEQIVLKLLSEMDLRRICACRPKAEETGHHEWVQERPEWVAALILIVSQWMVNQQPYDFDSGELITAWADALKNWEKLHAIYPTSPAEFFMMPPNYYDPLASHLPEPKSSRRRQSSTPKSSRTPSRAGASPPPPTPTPIRHIPGMEQVQDGHLEPMSPFSSGGASMKTTADPISKISPKHNTRSQTVSSEEKAGEVVRGHNRAQQELNNTWVGRIPVYAQGIEERRQLGSPDTLMANEYRSINSSTASVPRNVAVDLSYDDGIESAIMNRETRLAADISQSVGYPEDPRPTLEKSGPVLSKRNVQSRTRFGNEPENSLSYAVQQMAAQDDLVTNFNDLGIDDDAHAAAPIALSSDLQTILHPAEVAEKPVKTSTPSSKKHRKTSSISTELPSNFGVDPNAPPSPSKTRSGRRYSPNPYQLLNKGNFEPNADPPTPTPVSSTLIDPSNSATLSPSFSKGRVRNRSRRGVPAADTETEDPTQNAA